MYKFSIIVPIWRTDFNQLEECFNSIIRQDSSLLKEIILVNDGNDEEYKKKLTDFIKTHTHRERELVKLVNIDKNSGLANARKIGYQNSTGDIIIFVDSDDVLLNYDFLKKINNHFENNNKIFFVKYNYIQFKKISNLKNKLFNTNTNNEIITYNNNYIFKDYDREQLNVWKFAFKKDIFLICPQLLNNTINTWFEDVYFSAVFSSQNFVGLATSEIFYGYRVRNKNSIIHNFMKKQRKKPFTEILKVHEWFVSFKDANLNSNNEIKEIWISSCVSAVVLNGYQKLSKLIKDFPSKQDIYRFFNKYNYWKYKTLWHQAIMLMLKYRFFDFFIPVVVRFLYIFKR